MCSYRIIYIYILFIKLFLIKEYTMSYNETPTKYLRWIGTGEGFTRQFQMLSCMITVSRLTNRTLLLSEFVSYHYKNKYIYINDYVDLSLYDNIIARSWSEYDVDMMLKHYMKGKIKWSTGQPIGFVIPYQGVGIFYFPSGFKDNNFLNLISNILDMNDTTVYVFSIPYQECLNLIDFIPVHKYKTIYKNIKNMLFGDSDYDAIHWRRGDMCDLFNGSACYDPELWLYKFANKSNVYMSTNEKDNSILAKINSIGLKRFDFSSYFMLDAFIIELQILINSNKFYRFKSHSTVSDFVEYERSKIGKGPAEYIL